jgi:hypothetical protein
VSSKNLHELEERTARGASANDLREEEERRKMT